MPPKRLSPADKAHIERNRIYGKIRDGITILDCTVKSQEKCSEGEFLQQYIRILNRQLMASGKLPVACKLRHVRSSTGGISSLDDWLKCVYTYTIHISAHGNRDEKTHETYLWAGNSPFRLRNLKGVWSEFNEEDKPLLLVLSACSAGHVDLIKAFADEGCRYCIAPVFETDWEKAALFSALFYTYLFYGEHAEPMRPVTAFRKAKTRLPKLTGWWKMFDYGKELP